MGPTEEAAADRPEIIIFYFMKKGTKVELAEVGPILLAESGEILALNVVVP